MGETLYNYDSAGFEGANVNDVSTGHFPGRKQLRRLTQISSFLQTLMHKSIDANREPQHNLRHQIPTNSI